MSAKYTSNIPTIKAGVQQKVILALRLMLDAVDQQSTPKTPRRHGDLRNNKLKQVLGMHAVIQWRQRYAAAQEDKQHVNYTTPGTGPHYAENAVKAVVRDAGTYFRKTGL